MGYREMFYVCLFGILLYMSISHFSIIESFKKHDPILHELKTQLAQLDPKFENVELYEGDKSYTINKKKVYICLKDKNGRYYNRNMLVYVILHEYAHMLCDEVGHTDKFYRVFNHLLDRAERAGLYDPNISPIGKYCGH